MGISITDDLLRESEPLEQMFQVELGYAGTRDGCGTGEEDCRSQASMIDYSQYGIVPLAIG
jgi:hypothetical protein